MTQINLYEQLGSIQFQIDKLQEQKTHIIRQIEIQMTINSTKAELSKDTDTLNAQL